MTHELAMINELMEWHQELNQSDEAPEHWPLEATVEHLIDNDFKFEYIELQWLKELNEK